MTSQITSHSNYDRDDYEYLRAKGWTDKEILARWNEEAKRGNGLCRWATDGAKAKLGRTAPSATPAGVCPRCGEDDHDRLLWDEHGEAVTCQRCGIRFTVHRVVWGQGRASAAAHPERRKAWNSSISFSAAWNSYSSESAALSAS